MTTPENYSQKTIGQKVASEHTKEIERKLKEDLYNKYGEQPMSQIVGYRMHEMKKSKCDMCDEWIHHKESFRYVTLLSSLVDYDELWICKNCAKREHGSKNKYKWKDLYTDLKKGAS